MAEFHAAVTTNQGVALVADLLAGEQIEFTKLVTGSGVYGNEEIERTTLQKVSALREQRQEFGFSSISKVSDACVLLKTLLSNVTLTQGYRMTEIGVYAKKPGDEGDGILYSGIFGRIRYGSQSSGRGSHDNASYLWGGPHRSVFHPLFVLHQFGTYEEA